MHDVLNLIETWIYIEINLELKQAAIIKAYSLTPTQIYSTEHKLIEKITATEPQPNRTVLNYLTIFKNVTHNLEPGETPSNSGSKLCTPFLNIAKHGEKMTKFQLSELQRNRTGTGTFVNLIMTSTVRKNAITE